MAIAVIGGVDHLDVAHARRRPRRLHVDRPLHAAEQGGRRARARPCAEGGMTRTSACRLTCPRVATMLGPEVSMGEQRTTLRRSKFAPDGAARRRRVGRARLLRVALLAGVPRAAGAGRVDTGPRARAGGHPGAAGPASTPRPSSRSSRRCRRTSSTAAPSGRATSSAARRSSSTTCARASRRGARSRSSPRRSRSPS